MDTFTVDWLSFTIPSVVVDAFGGSPDQVALGLGLYNAGTWENRERGFLGWRESASLFVGATIAWGGQNGTYYVSISASGLAHMRVALGYEGSAFRRWLVMLASIGVRCRRIDLAFDDRSGVLDLDLMRDKWDRNEVSSRARVMTEVRDHRHDGERGGRTQYYGHRSSERCVRVYDKGAKEGVPGDWIRVELEIKGDAAEVFFSQWDAAGYGTGYAVGVLCGVLRFLERSSTDSNRGRWPSSPFWRSFTEGADEIPLVVPSACRDITDVQSWLVSQVSASLALLVECYGWERLHAVAGIGRHKMGPRQETILANSAGLLE